MAAGMLVATTADGNAQFEDVSNDLLLIDDGFVCPMVDRMKKGDKPMNTDVHSWTMERIGKPAGGTVAALLGAVPDGKRVVDADLVNNSDNRARLNGRTILQRLPFGVGTKTQEAANKPGIAPQEAYDHELLIAMRKIKRMKETAIVGKQNSVQEVGATASIVRGLDNWNRAAAGNASGDLPLPVIALSHAEQRIVASTAAGVSFEAINGAMAHIWSRTGRKGVQYQCLCSSTMKAQFGTFMTHMAPVNSVVPTMLYNGEIKSHAVERFVEIVTGDWGTLVLEASQFIDATQHFLAVPLDMVEMNDVFGARHEELARKGGGTDGTVETYWGMSVLDPATLVSAVTA